MQSGGQWHLVKYPGMVERKGAWGGNKLVILAKTKAWVESLSVQLPASETIEANSEWGMAARQQTITLGSSRLRLKCCLVCLHQRIVCP